MEEHDKHMEGFEKEEMLKDIWTHPDVRDRLFQWKDFLAVARVFNPELYGDAFERRPCLRKLRYVGNDNFDEPTRSERPSGPHIYEAIYHSVDFNGATYTISETGKVIGSAYFDVVEDL